VLQEVLLQQQVQQNAPHVRQDSLLTMLAPLPARPVLRAASQRSLAARIAPNVEQARSKTRVGRQSVLIVLRAPIRMKLVAVHASNALTVEPTPPTTLDPSQLKTVRDLLPDTR